MDRDAVLEVLAVPDGTSVQVWIDGGRGVDALLGEQTREHADLDLIVSAAHVPALTRALPGVVLPIALCRQRDRACG